MSGDLQTMDTADLVRLIVRRTARVEVVSDEDTLDGLLDEFGRAELSVAIGIRFRVDLPEPEFHGCKTVGDVARLVEKTIERRTP